jgi:hypothetical protein
VFFEIVREATHSGRPIPTVYQSDYPATSVPLGAQPLILPASGAEEMLRMPSPPVESNDGLDEDFREKGRIERQRGKGDSLYRVAYPVEEN